MAKTFVKPKRMEPGALLATIERNQSPLRRSVSETMEKVRSVYLRTRHDDFLEEEIVGLLDEMKFELKRLTTVPRPPMANRGGRILIVTGEAGAGKTRALATNFIKREEFAGFGQPGEACALISCVAPSPFTLKALGNEIVRKVGYNADREIPEGEVWPMVRLMMRELGVCILHIDEAQHGDQLTNPDIIANVENTFKRVLQDEAWPVWLILSGLPELANFCQNDDSVRRRVHHVRFTPLQYPDHVGTVRKTIERIVAVCDGMDCASVTSDEFVGRLLHASLGQFGILVEYVQDAISACLHAKTLVLSHDHFARAYAARTGETEDEKNVFKAAAWDKIAVREALYEQLRDETGKPIGKPKLKAGAKT